MQMEAYDVLDMAREAVVQALVAASPMLLAALVVGVVVGMLQTVLQIQDPALSTVPRVVAVVGVFVLVLPWLVERLSDYSQSMFSSLPVILGGG
jgi:flagellar biosynthetic protein FliQ